MKISLHLPQRTDMEKAKRFLRSEIAQARNIKKKNTRKTVETGLRAILSCL